jgi:hypothetical protein
LEYLIIGKNLDKRKKQMKYYNTNNGIRAIGEIGDIDGDQSHLVKPSWTEITEAEKYELTKPPEYTNAELADMVRTERNRRAVCAFDAKAKYERQQQNAAQDPPIVSDDPMTAEEYREVLDYIESLMQIPQQTGFPWSGPDDAACPWPAKPACVSDCSIP